MRFMVQTVLWRLMIQANVFIKFTLLVKVESNFIDKGLLTVGYNPSIGG